VTVRPSLPSDCHQKDQRGGRVGSKKCWTERGTATSGTQCPASPATRTEPARPPTLTEILIVPFHTEINTNTEQRAAVRPYLRADSRLRDQQRLRRMVHIVIGPSTANERGPGARRRTGGGSDGTLKENTGLAFMQPMTLTKDEI
jgi:hypothetical protein